MAAAERGAATGGGPAVVAGVGATRVLAADTGGSGCYRGSGGGLLQGWRLRLPSRGGGLLLRGGDGYREGMPLQWGGGRLLLRVGRLVLWRRGGRCFVGAALPLGGRRLSWRVGGLAIDGLLLREDSPTVRVRGGYSGGGQLLPWLGRLPPVWRRLLPGCGWPTVGVRSSCPSPHPGDSRPPTGSSRLPHGTSRAPAGSSSHPTGLSRPPTSSSRPPALPALAAAASMKGTAPAPPPL